MYLDTVEQRHSRWQIAQAEYALDNTLGQASTLETLSWMYCPEPPSQKSSLPQWLEMKEVDAEILYAREVVDQEKQDGKDISPYWSKVAVQKTQKEKSMFAGVKSFFLR